MANGIIAGVFTIVGVVLGVLLEPVKAAFLNRAHVRQERADRCAALLEAVTLSSTWLITLNRQLRDESAGRKTSLEPAAYERVTAEFVAARQNMRKLVWLLRLSGPDDLAEAAEQVRSAESGLRELRQEPDDDDSGGRDGMPRAIRVARAQLDTALGSFTDVARRHI
ncbi:hypothetical protein [Pseudonocardia sp.]|jgi:hypothetical protein|uniref:hypothetical protein n=1 Tax=Pseudonocardia sp. TaxID=60912 RepID=UPI0031FDA39C